MAGAPPDEGASVPHHRQAADAPRLARGPDAWRGHDRSPAPRSRRARARRPALAGPAARLPPAELFLRSGAPLTPDLYRSGRATLAGGSRPHGKRTHESGSQVGSEAAGRVHGGAVVGWLGGARLAPDQPGSGPASRPDLGAKLVVITRLRRGRPAATSRPAPPAPGRRAWWWRRPLRWRPARRRPPCWPRRPAGCSPAAPAARPAR